MLICPKCKYEYRDGFNVCPDCNRLLVEGKAKDEKNNISNTNTRHLVALLIVSILICIVLSIIIDSTAVGLIFMGLLFVILGYFWMKSQSAKNSVIDMIFSIAFLEPLFSGIGSILVGVFLVLLGVIIAFK